MNPTYVHSIAYKCKDAKNVVRYDDEFFIVDHEEPSILVFSTVDGKLLRTIGRSTNPEFPQLVHPNSMFITDDNKLFVSDTNGVHIFDSTTRAYLQTFPFTFTSANAICMSADTIFISDGNCIHVFSRTDYNYMDTIGKDKLEHVSSMCFFQDKLYIADEELCQVLIFDTKGNDISNIEYFNTPKSICISSTRNELVIANTYNNQIVIFDATTYKHIHTIDNVEYVYGLYAFENELYVINSNKLHVFTL